MSSCNLLILLMCQLSRSELMRLISQIDSAATMFGNPATDTRAGTDLSRTGSHGRGSVLCIISVFYLKWMRSIDKENPPEPHKSTKHGCRLQPAWNRSHHHPAQYSSYRIHPGSIRVKNSDHNRHEEQKNKKVCLLFIRMSGRNLLKRRKSELKRTYIFRNVM